MRKTRLVILPTKCLHQIGFLLLFLSCPVIGDWGRIRPDSENSHNAIKIDREGTCGLERDPPGGLVDFLNETGFKQCRPGEGINENDEKPIDERLKPQGNLLERRISERQSVQRRVNERLSSQRRVNERLSAQRRLNERQTVQRRVDERRDVRREDRREVRRVDERRDVRREAQRELRRVDERIRRETQRDVRRETQRDVRRETDRNVRSRSVEPRRSERSRFDVRARSLNRLDNERNVRERLDENRRLDRTRHNTVRQNERRVEERRVQREIRQNLREATRNTERERRDTTRSLQEPSIRRSNDQTRRQEDRVQNVRERRLSLARNELNNIRKTETRRRVDLSSRRTSTTQPELETRRLSLQKYRKDERFLNERLEDKPRRVARTAMTREFDLDLKNFEKEQLDETSKWTDLKNFKAGDWTTNCVIGAVVYFYTTRQVKTV